MTEAERVLTRASSSMSLLERLQKDAILRDDIFALLKQMEKDVDSVE